MQTSANMTANMNAKQIQEQNSLPSLRPLSERSFKLTLPAFVQGINAVGENFREQTKINSISAEKAVFSLKSPVTIGARLTLSLQIPRTLVLESAKNLLISGLVTRVQADTSKDIQLIALKLNRSFKILSMS